MLHFLDLPHDIQYKIFRHASTLQTFYYTKLGKQIRHSARHKQHYHSYVERCVFDGPGLPVFKSHYVLFSAPVELLSKLQQLTSLHAHHGRELNFLLKTNRTWNDMPPITKRILKQSNILHIFNVLIPKCYQHWIFEDKWSIDTMPNAYPVGEDPNDPEIDIDDIINRMNVVGLTENRMLVNNILVDLFEQNQYSFDITRQVTNEQAVIYLAWVMWWTGNWKWNIRYNDYLSLASLYNYNGRIEKKDCEFLAKLMTGEVVFVP